MDSHLPIISRIDDIVLNLMESQVLILVGETGCGKTTQIAQILMNAGFAAEGNIAITQPRRIAATSVAEYVAKQMGVELGGREIGYKIRHEKQWFKDTTVTFMTDGILLRELRSDPDLKKYKVIVIDEAHERSQNIDLCLGLLKDILSRRPDLKVIVTSATIDEQKFSDYFDGAPVINVSGRTYPVKIEYQPIFSGKANESMADAIVKIHNDMDAGDILAFVAGVSDINEVLDVLVSYELDDVELIGVHGEQSSEDQNRLFGKFPSKRKIIVATNIAETSITPDGVVYVVDSGYIKEMRFDSQSGIQSLELVDHSQSGCNQRAGRAGRTQPGICFRLYSEEDFDSRPAFTTPEILRTPIANVVLLMEDIGIANVKDFDFIDQPDRAAFNEAYETLIALGAIKRKVPGLTEIGQAMAELPLDVRVSRMLIEAKKYGCVREVATIAAFLSARNIFVRPREESYKADAMHRRFKGGVSSDSSMYLRIWQAYEASNQSYDWCREHYLNGKFMHEIAKARWQILTIMKSHGVDVELECSSEQEVRRAVSMGLAYDLYQKYDGTRSYKPVFRDTVYSEVFIHPGSAAFQMIPRFMVTTKVLSTTKQFAHGVTEVELAWLPELAPDRCRLVNPKLKSWDKLTGVVIVTSELYWDGMHVGNVEDEISEAEAVKIQDKQVADARIRGYFPLRFEFIASGEYGRDIFATRYKGNRLKYISSMFGIKVDEGETYFCSFESTYGYGEKIVKVLFQVFEFETGEFDEEVKATAAAPFETRLEMPQTFVTSDPTTRSFPKPEPKAPAKATNFGALGNLGAVKPRK